MTNGGEAAPRHAEAGDSSANGVLGLELWAWAGILLLGLALRLVWWHLGALVIGDEGANYARVAESLAAGRGYLGLSELGPQIIYPPLYPGLIAAGTFAGLSAETSGRLVSLLCGVATPLVFGVVARRLYGSKASLAAGFVGAVHPLLQVASVVVLSESLYLFLVLLGLHQVLRWIDEPRWIGGFLAGLWFGLAYLCRPESMYLAVVCALIFVVSSRGTRHEAVTAVAALIVTFAMCALPYVVYLHEQTGQWRLEAKTPQGMIWLVGLAEGRSPGDLYWGIDENLNGRGTSVTSNVEQAHVEPPPRLLGAKLAILQATKHLPKLLRGVAHLQFGGPAFAVLVGLGLFGAAWKRSRLVRELPLVAWAGLTVLPFMIWPFVLDRSLFMLLPVFVLWAAPGLVQLADWARASIELNGLGARSSALVVGALLVVVTATYCVTSLIGVRETDELPQNWSDRVELIPVGRWLEETAPRARIADVGATVAFYSGAVLIRYPFTDGATALRYLERNEVAYLVLREGSLGSRPYLQEWFDHPPTPPLELVRTFSSSTGAVRIYRWRGSSSG